MLKNYFKIALRRLRADQVHTVINVLGLALGITSCLVIYIFIRYELSFDGFHSESVNTYRIVEHSLKADGVQHWPTTAYPLAEAIRRDLPGVKVSQTAGPMSRIISTEDSKRTVHRFEEKRLMFADQNYLQTFDFRKALPGGVWLAGTANTAFEQPNAVVLTQKLADRYFAENKGSYGEIIGKTLMLNNIDPVVVSGVIRNPPHNTNLLYEMLVNYAFFKANNQYQANNWSGNYQGTTYVTLAPGADIHAFEKQLAGLKAKYMNPEDNRRISYFLQPLADIHTNVLYEDFLGGYQVSRQMLLVLGSLAVFLILIASFNFINLTTAQAARRNKEVGVRKVVGSTQTQLFIQLLGETLIVAGIAGIVSALALELLLMLLNNSLSIINLDLHTDFSVWLFTAGLVVVVALLAGLYPASMIARFQPVKALKNTGNTERQRISLRQGLIVLQFCITYGLLVGTFVASRQMDFFRNKDLGFIRDAVITVNGPRNQSVSKIEVFRHKLLENPAIREVSLSSGAPITENYFGTDFRLKSEPVQMNRQAEMKVVDLRYQSLFGLQTLAGRWFSNSNIVKDGDAFNGFVVNETMVKMLGLTPETALGKTVMISEGEAPILGVVKDFHNVSLQQQILPCVLICWNTGFYEQIHIGLQAGSAGLNLPDFMRSVEESWKDAFPQDVYEYAFLNDSLAKGYIVEQLVFDSFRIFAGISIFIACLGLFGLIAFTANQRTKEIGVRKVLGASVMSVVVMLSKDFVKLVVVAIVVASPLTWYALNRWLMNFEYKIGIEWWVFVAAGFLALGIALFTISFQSIKSALMNPVRALTSE